MPTPVLKDLAKKWGVKLDKLEKYWDEAKKITQDEFNKKEKDFTDKDWAYTMGIVKNMAGVKEKVIESTTLSFLESDKSAKEFFSEISFFPTIIVLFF